MPRAHFAASGWRLIISLGGVQIAHSDLRPTYASMAEPNRNDRRSRSPERGPSTAASFLEPESAFPAFIIMTPSLTARVSPLGCSPGAQALTPELGGKPPLP